MNQSKHSRAEASNNNGWTSDLGNGRFQNPVLHADYSDPDAIRVGDDFYMTASSFNHTPGLPILHSKDLVNWQLVNYAIDNLELPGYDKPRHGDGVWAPSLRYHDNKFWIFFGAPDEGLFMTTAADPLGEWTPLHCIKEVKGWIDCCPFWDDDGQAYLVHAYANSRCGIKHKLSVCRMSPDGTRLLDDGILVFDGTEHHPTMEGPKMYKRNGYYYIFAPAGGVRTGWQTILRSKSIFGPYEDKIVLHQGDSPINGPHQGGLVELENGEAWFLHFQDKGAYGRIVHLQPVEWVDDWPMMGHKHNADGIGEPVLEWTKPSASAGEPVVSLETSDDFSRDRLSLQWQWNANHKPGWYSLKDNPGHLRLYASAIPDQGAVLHDAPQLLMQKFPAPAFTATAKLSFHPGADGDRAGLVVFGRSYRALDLQSDEDGELLLRFISGKENTGVEHTTASHALSSRIVYLKVAVSEDAVCRFSFSEDGQSFTGIGEAFQSGPGAWVGAKVGLYAVNAAGEDSPGYADCEWFEMDTRGLQD